MTAWKWLVANLGEPSWMKAACVWMGHASAMSGRFPRGRAVNVRAKVVASHFPANNTFHRKHMLGRNPIHTQPILNRLILHADLSGELGKPTGNANRFLKRGIHMLHHIQKNCALLDVQHIIFAPRVPGAASSIQGMGIADKIRELRERKNLTQKQLAELCGVRYQSVQYWERGHGGAPRHKRLEKLASVLGVSVSELVQEGDERFPGIKDDARELLDELLQLAKDDKLTESDIGLIRSIVGRLSGAPSHPMRRKTDRESDWITDRPGATSINQIKKVPQ